SRAEFQERGEVAIDLDRPPSWLVNVGNQAEQGALSCPVATDQSDAFAVANREINPFEHPELFDPASLPPQERGLETPGAAVAERELLFDSFNFDRHLAHGRSTKLHFMRLNLWYPYTKIKILIATVLAYSP